MNTRKYKGKSLLCFPEDYTVIDIETTGISPQNSEIIEISAVRYRGHKKTSVFSTLVKPSRHIPRFITGLTGINDSMVKDAPDITSAAMDFLSFAGDDILMGYNVNFDINFLYDALMRSCELPLTNDFVDVLRFARKALKELPNRSQTTVAAHYGISVEGAHRAQTDCEICQACYLRLMNESVFEKQEV